MEARALLTNILFIGDSYTDNGSANAGAQIAPLVVNLASAAGIPAPTTEEEVIPGGLLVNHAALLTPSELSTLIPAGQAPDDVVIQGQSLEAASGVPSSQFISNGQPADHVAQFVQGALGIAADIRAVYPNAHFILYETWARTSNSSTATSPAVYPTDYPGPAQMQADINHGYVEALDALRNQYGTTSTDLAPAGDAFWQLGFNNALYNPGDIYSHPTSFGGLVAALTIFDAIYTTNSSAISPTAAANLLASRGLSNAQFTAATAAADAATGLVHASQDQGFVQQAYEDILGRQADPSGLNTFTLDLETGALSRGQVAEILINSTEYHDDTINDEYNLYLGRTPDTGGAAYFQNLLAAPGATIDQMRVTILGSGEYYARSGGTNAGLVMNIYEQVLHRAPATSELNYWVNELNGGLTQAQFAQIVVNSTENRQRQVGNLYENLLQRPADAGGLATFTQILTSGYARYEDVVAVLIASTEYYERFA